MSTLKHGGIVRTTLGAHGGYAIADDPSAISIGRVIRLLDGALAPAGCVIAALLRAVLVPGRGDLPAARRDARRPRRDARDPRHQSRSPTRRRQGRASIDPRGSHADALAGRRP